MGQIIISIAAGIAKRELHIETLNSMQLEKTEKYASSKSAGYSDKMRQPVNAADFNIQEIDVYCEDVLRVPSCGYSKGVYSVPRNNIIIEDVNNGFMIEFINAKCKVIRENTIIEMAVVNRDGTVKEFINAKDYIITISGDIVADSQYNFPVDEMKTLIWLLDQKLNMNIENALLGLFGIRQVVFKHGTFDQTTAKYVNAMPFSLDFVSDENYDFLVEDNI
jgi:hypothetical protein